MIEFAHVSKDFGTGQHQVHAVKDVSFSIEEGEIFGIIGFSGAGKSTLVRCINLLERPTSGTVTVDGRQLTALSPRELREARKKIGMIFQHFNLMPSRTVFSNVAYPLRGSGLTRQEIAGKVRRLLELVGISDKETAYPSQLSGGQKQRVAIARALANDPKILLCDEATSALDPQTTKSILQLLKHLNEELGITVVIITHEMAVVKEICSRVAVMEHGQVAELGEVFSIFANQKQPITQNFIRTTSNLQKIEALIAEDSPVTRLQPGELIVRLSYVQRNVSEPLISTISQRFGVQVNIIFADIELVQDAPIGGTVAILSGERTRITQAITYVITDEVYEHIVYAPFQHTYFASLPGMWERTISCSSLSKTYSITGWRLGYTIAPPEITERIKKAHAFLTVGAAAPLQEAVIPGLYFGQDYYDDLLAKYTHKRGLFLKGLDDLKLPHTVPQGAYYVLMDISEFGFGSDLDFCEALARDVGVGAVPGSSFFREPVSHLIRFHFAKKDETLLEALNRLERLRRKIPPRRARQ